MIKIPPRTQQTSRTHPESLVSIPHTSSSTQRTQNFWAVSTTHSHDLNHFIHNSYQKPISSIFLTSKTSNLTPMKKSSNPLIRKFSEPLVTERPFTTSENNEYRAFLNKENPLTVRENNSKFYQKMRKIEDDKKISINRLILESYGFQKPKKNGYPLNQSNQKLNSFESLKSYGIQPQSQSKNNKFKEDFFMKPTFKNMENQFQKTLEIEKPKTGLAILKQIPSESEDDLFERHVKLRRKFNVKTFLSQKEELRLKGTSGSSDREVNKRLVIPKLYDKIDHIKRRIVLTIENIYLNECKNKNSLKYCYLQLPIIENVPVMSSSMIENEFQEVLRVLKEKFNFNTKELYVFLKNGQEIKSHYEIPPEEKTIIISGNRLFKGLNRNLVGNKIQGFLLMKTVCRLERPLIDQEPIGKQPISIEKHIKDHYTDVVHEVIDILGQTGEKTSEDLEEINKIYNKKKKFVRVETLKEKKIDGRLNFKDKKEYFDVEKSGLPLIYSKKFDDVSQICDIYDRNNQEIDFDNLEREDGDEGEGGLTQELENMKNLEEKGQF